MPDTKIVRLRMQPQDFCAPFEVGKVKYEVIQGLPYASGSFAIAYNRTTKKPEWWVEVPLDTVTDADGYVELVTGVLSKEED